LYEEVGVFGGAAHSCEEELHRHEALEDRQVYFLRRFKPHSNHYLNE
jgi:hypothetical protein